MTEQFTDLLYRTLKHRPRKNMTHEEAEEGVKALEGVRRIIKEMREKSKELLQDN